MTTDKSKRGRNARRKGRAFEQWVARRFRPIFPEAKRGLQARSGGEAPDVLAGPFFPECKVGKHPDMGAALEQASDGAESTGKIPVAVCRRDHCHATVTMWFDDFLGLVREWDERGS